MAEGRWIRLGGGAGLVYVLVAVVAATLTGAPPQANGDAAAYQSFFVEKQSVLVTQAWMYALAAPLMLMFAVAVHAILRRSDDSGYLGGVFLLGTAAVATLLLVTQAIQIAVAQHADRLPAGIVFTMGVHFPGVLIGLWGSFMAATAFAYAYCVFVHGALPRWTAYLAVLALAVNLLGTVGVFFRTGAFSIEGGAMAWAPATSTVLWYLGTSIAVLRAKGLATTPLDAAAQEYV